MNSQQAQGAPGRVVVGVDGSAPARAALSWAVRQAELTGATVEAVIAWHSPVSAAGYGFAPVAAVDWTDFEAIAATSVSDAIAGTVDPACPVKITTSVREGDAAQALLDAAVGAELLVVGSRGHGGFAGALLGSVSQHCAQHAPCPIVIVRDAGQR